MDLSRSDILALLLRLLKDSLTKGNKIIRRRPQKGPQALDAAQSFDKVIPGSSTPIKPLDYGIWPSSPQPLSEALRRDNLMEATQNSMMGLTQEQRRMSTKEEDTFTEFRQILLSFGHRYDAGGRVFVLQDTQQESAIIVRVRRGAPFLMSIPPPSFWLVLITFPNSWMYALSPIRPVRLYKRVKPTPAKRLYNTISPFIAPSTAIISVSTTELERKMFLKLVS